MITLAILSKMVEDGVADLTVDKDFFWEEAPLQKNGELATGVWLVTRGGNAANSPHGWNLHSTIDFYVAFASKPKTEAVHYAILEWILANRSLCDLSGSVGDTTYAFSNVRIKPTTTPENFGATENGLIVKIASAEVIYNLDANIN